MKAGRGKEVLQPLLRQLLRYTEQHFVGEEATRKARGYHDLATQSSSSAHS
jgi:hemerythrin